uniref:Uncharacterized protein n=1 Tax=Craspedostauros australis TaxID=1486917 RepID=A0A7R9WS54_9STRA
MRFPEAETQRMCGIARLHAVRYIENEVGAQDCSALASIPLLFLEAQSGGLFVDDLDILVGRFDLAHAISVRVYSQRVTPGLLSGDRSQIQKSICGALGLRVDDDDAEILVL